MNKDVFNLPKPVTIMGRSSSITNSFVNGIIPVIAPTDEEIREALKVLGQDENDVRCVYCGDKKTEWDHLHPLIKNKKHSGYITEIANLVPACGKCNQSKGNSDWKEWMLSDAKKSPKIRKVADLQQRINTIEKYDNLFHKTIVNLEELAGEELWNKYQKSYNSLISTMEFSQKIMDEIKQKISNHKEIKKHSTVNNDTQNKAANKQRNEKCKSIESFSVDFSKEKVEALIKDESRFWDGFQNYLVKNDYRLYTPSGNPSTVFEYIKAVSKVLTIESLNLIEFCMKISSIIKEYDEGGSKEALGRIKHNTWINGLKRFSEYIHFCLQTDKIL